MVSHRIPLPHLLSAALGCAMSSTAIAADYTIAITNLTRGIYFTPLLVAAHSPAASVFASGTAASASVQSMAEGGNIAPLVADLEAVSATLVQNPAAGLLQPGGSTQARLNTDDAPDNTRLSMVAMMLPTNDGFMGLSSLELPVAAGTYTYEINAYDAGTEANDEVRGSGAPGEPGFPAPGPVDAAAGSGGSGVAAVAEGFVHIHRNVLGDTDASAGNSDVDAVVHRWLNPVARIRITVN